MRGQVLALGFVILAATGCSGTVVMTPVDTATIASDYDAKKDTVGIIVYRAKPVVEVDKLTQANVPDPSKPGATIASDNCEPVLSRKVTSIPDWSRPYRLHYDHGFLETYTFGATLTSDGILTVINSQSTPDQGKTFQNLASAASTSAGIVHTLETSTTKPRCTITPIFYGFEQLPIDADIKPFNSIQAQQ